MTDSQPRRILIVDDQQSIHDTFDRIFARRYSCDVALGGFEAKFLSYFDDAGGAGRGSIDAEYELTHASSGHQAIDCVRDAVENRQCYSVAFVDMRMPPGLDGLQTTEAIWQLDPQIQVVICTAHSDHTWGSILDKLGSNDRLLLLKKPFESDEIRQLALALTEKSRLMKAERRKLEKLQIEVERRKQVEKELLEIAQRDSLTSLPNRSYLLKRLKSLAESRQRVDSAHHAVLFLDLDNFKVINDSLGHDAGDELLNQVASRLQECVRTYDTTVRSGSNEGKTIRLGGDEFVILLEQLRDPKDAITVARRVIERLSEPFELADRLVNVGTSIGVAFVDQYVRDGVEALRNADTAMYRAKQSGKGCMAIFDQAMHDAVCARLDLENQLRKALRDESFTLRYQPIIGIPDGRIRGVEALLRWRDEAGKEVPPSEFAPVIEEIGLITQLGEWVIEKATRQFGGLLKQLSPEAGNDIYVAVNIARCQLSDPFFVDRLDTILKQTRFDRRSLKLEMTESVDPQRDEQALQTMLELQDSGIGIHIDDFGKGHSSLTCFQAYPIEMVKIDRSFTASIACEHGHAVIAQAIVQLAHHLNARVVAEGVESERQLEKLRQWGCDLAQGYLFAPPLTLNQLERLLRDPTRCDGIRLLRNSSGIPAMPMISGSFPTHPTRS